MLASWRAVADAAPLAIEAEWATDDRHLETAATVDPTDPALVGRQVAETARASEPAANRVIDYTFQLCNAAIGGVAPVDHDSGRDAAHRIAHRQTAHVGAVEPSQLISPRRTITLSTRP